jgi:hypothetical protein
MGHHLRAQPEGDGAGSMPAPAMKHPTTEDRMANEKSEPKQEAKAPEPKTKMLVMNKRSGMHHVGELHFQPGLNEVPQERWEEALQLPAFAALVDDGTFEEVQTKSGKPVAAADVPSLPEKQAISLIKETTSKSLLNAWQLVEKRQPVLDAIQDQFDAIDPRKK